MTKVYPNASVVSNSINTANSNCTSSSMISAYSDENCRMFTVWKKSLLFNCDGFTVLDAKGSLAFRVDNYGSTGEVVLMDASGKPLQTIRRKRLSMSGNWLLYDGEKLTNPILSVRKHVSLLSNARSCLAHVNTMLLGNKGRSVYEIEGSYTKRCCVIYDSNRNRVAEIKRKESAVVGAAFGFEVFRLIIVEPDLIDSSVAMSLVILLDQMFGSPKR
ncbi:protein LURP-one-related 8-like [Impatiens glandulifera]|uniref:protein LURP-one-related 8-like n=1 Tax=Impatiens glandulifera TaxID=253017 RepID=UPI001FB07E6F|nr:protein LURP-one-related 8-like [Impatiens glandulifera]